MIEGLENHYGFHKSITETPGSLLMQIKKLAEGMGFEFLHGIVDCMLVIGEPISVFKEAAKSEMGISTEVDTHDWITFLPIE